MTTSTTAMCSRPSEAQLRDIVQRYQVTWARRTEMATHDGTLEPVGYVIELKAVPEGSRESLISTRPEWHEVETALECLALAVAAPQEVDVPRGRLQIGNDQQPEMLATITVVHQHGTVTGPPDAAEHERLEQIVGRLGALGAREGSARR